MTSREVSEWAAYLRWLDGAHEAPPRPSPPAAGDAAEVSWQRLLSFADRANAKLPGA